MSTPAQIEANRHNAARSTEPKTAGGKARSSQNALRHGLRSELPVLPGEDSRGWEEHRAGILRSLAPAGPLEAELAGRVALSLWRLRRVAVYETAVTALGVNGVAEEARAPDSFTPGKSDQERLQKTLDDLRQRQETVDAWEGSLRLLERLPDLPADAPVEGDDVEGVLHDVNDELPGDGADPDDPDFLAGLGVPADELDNAWAWDGWTAGMVRQAAEQMAQECKTSAAKVLARALQGRQEAQNKGREEVKHLQRQARDLRRRVQAKEDRLRQQRMLADAKTLDKVLRYESHVSRQVLQALHTLERLQAARAGEPVPPPAALDVTISGDGPGPAHALAEGAAAVLQDGEGP
jgi:hypothetical protein